MDLPQEIKSDGDSVRPAINPSSSFYLTLSESEIRDNPYAENPAVLSVTTAVLDYCKYKIIRPYLRLLSITGLRSLWVEQIEASSCWDIISGFYTVQVIILMLIGYLLQYMSCFRRDRGFCYKLVNPNSTPTVLRNFEYNEVLQADLAKYEQICQGSAIFSYIIPSTLHLCGYLYAVYVFRSSENDQLPSLMERVFLSCSHITDGFASQRKLVRLLWIFVTLGIVWMLLSFTTVMILMFEGTINFKWLENRPNNVIILMKVMLIIGTLWHDIIQATVISSYCLQAQLLTSYLHFIRAELLQYPIHSIDWMREISEFKKLLRYLNKDLSLPVCILTFINLCWTISGTVWLLGFDQVDKATLPITGISILNVGLWLTLTLAPFLQAARLSGACRLIQSVGHEVRARPFVHQGTPGSELDSILLYASSLEMNATLFKIPITGRVLAVGITFSAVVILVIGQCHYLSS